MEQKLIKDFEIPNKKIETWKFTDLKKVFEKNNFIVIDSGMYWNKRDDGLVWVFVDKKDLSKKQILKGPPTYGMQNHIRSEEHTSELQSRRNLVCRLLLEKKTKKKKKKNIYIT